MIDDISSYIDHTLLAPTASMEAITKLCEEAREYSFASVCVPPSYVSLAHSKLSNQNVKVCTVIGFPLGYNLIDIKMHEAWFAVDDGADELDMVINQCAVKSGDFDYVFDEVAQIKDAFPNTILKVIVETCNLNLIEKERLVNIVIDSGADYIKTSTGFGSAGAQISDVKLFKKIAGDKIKIKAAGGIRDRKTALEFICAGASRIGASNGVEIIKEL